MNMNETILLTALAERWGKYREELKRCKEEFSEEAVHDLRVATRRLVAVMNMLRILDPHPRVQKVRRALKQQLDSLDELRDTQVMLAEVYESISNFPELKPFGEYLLAREKKLLRHARKEIKALHIAELKKRIEKSQESLDEKLKEKGWTANLLSVVDQAYARARQAYGEIDARKPATIHRFRVTFKKFRYMVEIVHPILKDVPEEYLKQLHDYQSHMGDIQDAAVLLNMLTEYTDETDSGAALSTTRKAFETHRAELIARFMEGKEAIRIFWRDSPEAIFAWEKP